MCFMVRQLHHSRHLKSAKLGAFSLRRVSVYGSIRVRGCQMRACGLYDIAHMGNAILSSGLRGPSHA